MQKNMKGLIRIFKKMRYFFHGDMVACFQRTFRCLQNLAYLGVFHVFVVFQLEDRALHIRQFLQSLLQ